MNPMMTVLCRTIRTGTVAFSPNFHCKAPKTRDRMPNPMNNSITLVDLQGEVSPPDCSAKNKQLMAPTNITIPTGSIRCNFFQSGRSRVILSIFFSLRKRRTKAKTTAPRGTLLSVSAAIYKIRCERTPLHPEAPSPAYTIRQNTTKDWSSTHTDPKNTYHNSHIERPLFQRGDVGNDPQCSLKNPSSSDACDGPTYNEDI